MVRHRTLTPAIVGSIPTVPANTGEDNMYNQEHYKDATAYTALQNIEQERLKQTMKQIKKVLRDNDFELLERIVIRDNRTGKIYK